MRREHHRRAPSPRRTTPPPLHELPRVKPSRAPRAKRRFRFAAPEAGRYHPAPEARLTTFRKLALATTLTTIATIGADAPRRQLDTGLSSWGRTCVGRVRASFSATGR